MKFNFVGYESYKNAEYAKILSWWIKILFIILLNFWYLLFHIQTWENFCLSLISSCWCVNKNQPNVKASYINFMVYYRFKSFKRKKSRPFFINGFITNTFLMRNCNQTCHTSSCDMLGNFMNYIINSVFFLKILIKTAN